ncbi:cupredoxin domain-containing protein [Streptomyces sp. NPDC056411]|uniref:cupredoxin domain-containing protein n=1 Tax=Streptomyces sp. NPDC056411 TaxID=3345813 RepID=UPI0035D536D4
MRNTARTALTAVAAALIVTVAGGCSGGTGGTAPSKSPAPSVSHGPSGAHSPGATGPSVTAPARITIKDFAFKPATLTVRPGAKVTVVNEDSTAHDVSATGPKAFDTGTIEPGKTVTFTAPTKPGSYPYVCDIHPYMKATLSVR